MNDIFREVDEEYRQEQLLQFWHNNAKIIIFVLLMAIAGAAAGGYWKNRQQKDHENQTYTLAEATAAAANQAPSVAKPMLDKAAGELSGNRAAAAHFADANITQKSGDKAGAVKLYDEIATSSDATKVERDLATILSVNLQLQDGDPDQLSARLDKLADDKSAWKYTAREWQALLAMRQNNPQKAHDLALALARDPKTPEGVKGRAIQLAAMTGEGLAPDPEPIASGDNPMVQLPEGQ